MTRGVRLPSSLYCVVPMVCALLATICAVLANARGGVPHRHAQFAEPQQSSAHNPQENIPLEPGKPIERAMTGSEKHRYELRLQKGQCAVIQVEQRAIDVVVHLLGGDNDLVVEVDDEISKGGTEKLDVVAENDGNYTVIVKPKLKLAAGAYEIRLVEIHTATSLDRSLFETRQLRTKANQLLDMDKSNEALPLAERALALAQEALGTDDVYVALVMKDLAEITAAMRKPEEARPGYERALQVLTAKLGAEHAQTILVKGYLGQLYIDLDEFSKADQLLNKALESGERTLGRDDPILVGMLRSLGILHANRGDYDAMEREFLRALAIAEDAGLTEGRQYGQLLNGLGVTYNLKGEPDRARTYLERALAFRERKFGPESLAVSDVLENLGSLCTQTKDYGAAEKYFLRSLALREKYLGPEHPDYGDMLANLAAIYFIESKYQKSLEMSLRALNILEKTWSSGDKRGGALYFIANNYAALGDFQNANKFQSQFQSAVESDIAFNLEIGSERQKLAYLSNRYVADYTDIPISLNLQLEPDNSQAAVLAATVLLQRKGRVLDAMTETLATLRKHSDPQDQVLLDQLKEATTQLARVALQGPQKESLEDHRRALQDLEEKKEQLESVISRHNEEFRAQYQTVTTEAVRSAIPGDCALVEFVAYRPFNSRATTEELYGDLRYAAYVLHRNTAPKGVDLGDAKTINAAVGRLRAALRDPSRNDVQQLAQAVAAKVFQPLQSLVADDKRMLVSPDGQLNLIPFEALLDGQGRYLVERFSITYLPTGRDLLRMQVPRESKSAPLLVADPSFGEPVGTMIARAPGTKGRLSRSTSARRSITTGEDLSSMYFAPLGGTAQEARTIKSLFPEAQVLTGQLATKAALKQVEAPRLLHIATHGFFLLDPENSTALESPKTGVNGTRTTSAGARLENPLLRSGLALAGANLNKGASDDGILTALEASNLNLWGTKLVTLSACDTGVGEVRNGEGVYGLRRAFFLAGTESLVMSLWPVSDYVTRELMTDYYSGLKRGFGRGEALRLAQLAMLKRKGRQHPFYWASFIQAGEWANLDGQR
jgi:CHAT domain-containing protein/Tfp pilus assembly protein PilF